MITENRERVSKRELILGVILVGLVVVAVTVFIIVTSPLKTPSHAITIQGEGYVIDAPDVPGQMYLLQEDGTTTTIVPGE